MFSLTPHTQKNNTANAKCFLNAVQWPIGLARTLYYKFKQVTFGMLMSGGGRTTRAAFGFHSGQRFSGNKKKRKIFSRKSDAAAKCSWRQRIQSVCECVFYSLSHMSAVRDAARTLCLPACEVLLTRCCHAWDPGIRPPPPSTHHIQHNTHTHRETGKHALASPARTHTHTHPYTPCRSICMWLREGTT